MGKTHRHFGRENGHESKRHRWWRKNEGDYDRKDDDRQRVSQNLSFIANEEGIKVKNRSKSVPCRDVVRGYGYKPFRNTPIE